MKKTTHPKMLFILGTMLLMTSSCQKDSALLPDASNSGTADMKKVSEVMLPFNDLCDYLGQMQDHSFTTGKSQATVASIVTGACGSLFIDTLSMPRVISIDFGPTNCKNSGHWYRGKITVTFTGSYRQPGSVYKYFTENFYQDNNRIDVDRTITNINKDGQTGNSQFTIADYVKLTFALGGSSITQEAAMHRVWSEGESTSNSDDDVYMLSGTQMMSFSAGPQFEVETKEDLRKENAYPYYTSGLEKINRLDNNSGSYLLDYGYPDGQRDDLALATYKNGSTEVIHLSK